MCDLRQADADSTCRPLPQDRGSQGAFVPSLQSRSGSDRRCGLPESSTGISNPLEWVDLICFGSPCQDLSLAGKRKGLVGERSGLYFEAVRIIKELRPIIAVWENVPGALSSNSGRDFGTALDALADAGAVDIAWRVLDAQWFGVAQRRRRLFVVASFRDGASAAEILFEPESCVRDTPPSRQVGAGVTRTLTSSPGRSKFDPDRGLAYPLTAHEHRDGDCDTNYVVDRPLKAGGNDRQEESHETYIVANTLQGHHNRGQHEMTYISHPLTSEGAAASEDGTPRPVLLVAFTQNQQGDVLTGQGFPAMGTNSNATGRNTPKVLALRMREGKPGGGKGPLLSEGKPLTLAGGNDQTIFSGMAARRLTPTEAEKLQGFPPGWTAQDAEGKPISDSARYRMLGNAVCTKVSAWLGKRIVEVERRSRKHDA
ncbi:MAG: DNA (cytosine-5-)-methyltransferase [Spirochaetota bacterium]